MAEIRSYAKIYALGHKAIFDILQDPVIVQEKVDGSQFSFGVIDGELSCRSKGQQINLDAPDGLFAEGVEQVKAVANLLTPGWVYRGEYLKKPKHNTLVYDRIPRNHIALFDIDMGMEDYMNPARLWAEASYLGFESVPILHWGTVNNIDEFKKLLDTVSFLGGQKIEGVVVKNYTRFTTDGRVMMGKFVSEKFKETHQGEWRKNNPPPKDIIDRLIIELSSPARWQKAVQHLEEAGMLEGSPRDIGLLIKEVPKDILSEESDYITDQLLSYFIPKITRGVTQGLPEWYKELLAERAFDV